MRFGLPSGRLRKYLPSLSQAIGRDLPDSPIARTLHWREGDDDFFKVRASAIPALVAQGLLDFGVCGSDSIDEFLMPELLDVREICSQGGVRMAVAAHDPDILKASLDRPLVVGTSYPVTASGYLGTRLGKAHIIVEQPGCIEGLCPSLVDLIVDIAETGDTLRANGLVELGDLGPLTIVTVTRIGQHR